MNRAAVLVAAFGLFIAPAMAQSPVSVTRNLLTPFDTSPFPYHGIVPKTGRPFLDVEEGERRGRNAPRGGILWEDETYSDKRVLLSIPRGFDVRRPAVITVFFHGNGATLARDVRGRQRVPRQIAESGLNTVLVAPQFAVDAADSSAGRFWEPGAFAHFLDEAAARLAGLHGDRRAKAAFARAPIVIAAYSGGYLPLAYTLARGGANERLRGILLIDALYGDFDKYIDWLAGRPPAFFVSTYGPLTKNLNDEFRKQLSERNIPFTNEFPPYLMPGIVSFVDAGEEVRHNDFVTQAWSSDPLKVMLSRIPGFVR